MKFESPSFTANYYMNLTDEEAIEQLAKMGIKWEPACQKQPASDDKKQD